MFFWLTVIVNSMFMNILISTTKGPDKANVTLCVRVKTSWIEMMYKRFDQIYELTLIQALNLGKSELRTEINYRIEKYQIKIQNLWKIFKTCKIPSSYQVLFFFNKTDNFFELKVY